MSLPSPVLRARTALAAAALAAAGLFSGCATEPSYMTKTLPWGASFDPARVASCCNEKTPELFVCPRCTNSASDRPMACIDCGTTMVVSRWE